MNLITPEPTVLVAESVDGGTARALIDAVEAVWGPLAVDLAAEAHNAKCTEYITPEENSLSVDWAARLAGRRGWLNPPFTSEDIEPWSGKCFEEARSGARLLVLCPINLNAPWWWRHMRHAAATWVLTPCMTADGVPTTMAVHTYNIGVAGQLGQFYWGERGLVR